MANRPPLPPVPAQAKPLREIYAVAALLVLTAATYLQTLQFDFVSDDGLQIADNPFIKSWRYLPHYFVITVWSHLGAQSPGNFYRPIYLLWNLVNYSLFGLNPVGWHAAAILLHLAVTGLVYQAVRQMTRRTGVAWLTALIFGVHPVHPEVVAWVSGVTDSLYAAFFLGAFLTYLHFREKRSGVWMAVSVGLYGLAVFSKETAIVLPVLIFAYAWIASDSSGTVPDRVTGTGARFQAAFRAAALYLPVAAIYLFTRARVVSGLESIHVHMPVSMLLLTWPSVLAFYLKLWLVPAHYSLFYDMNYYSRASFSGVILPGLALLAVGGALWFGRRRLGARETGYAAAWILIPLLPVLNLGVFRLGELAHDRYFYVPSLGAALIVALLLAAAFGLENRPLRMAFVGMVLAIPLMLCTLHASSYWKDNLILLTHVHEIAPENMFVRNDLAVEWLDRGQTDKAKELLEQLVRDHPENWLGWANLGRTDYRIGDYADAETSLRRAITLNPGSAAAFTVLGQVELRTNRSAEALASEGRAVELLPLEYRFHTIYGVTFEATGDCHSAIAQFETALTLHPGDEISQQQLDLCRASLRSSNDASPAIPVR